MKKNKFINEDLKSLQDLQEKYQMKKKDIFDRLISDDINDKETVVKELDEIEKDRNLMTDNIAQQMDAERELVIELLEEIELDPVHFTDDNPDDVQYTNTPENREKGIIRDYYEDDDIPF